MKIYVLMDNQPRGPYSAEFIRQMLNSGRFLPTHLGAYEGSADWKPLAEMIQSWDAAPPKRSKLGLIIAVTVGALVLFAGAGAFFWQAHRKTGEIIVTAPKQISTAETKSLSTATAKIEDARPTPKMLVGKRFRFSWKSEKGGGSYPILVFNADGTLSGGTGSANETFWTIDEQGRPVFKHRDGRVSTIFNHAKRQDGRWSFSGQYQFNRSVEHLLAEVASESDGIAPAGTASGATQPDAATRLKELKQLYDQGLVPQDIYEQKRQKILDSL